MTKSKQTKDTQAQYQVLVFGKAGCDKCAVLEKRLDSLLAKSEWNDFEKVKFDLESEDGLVEFCSIECLNPQRVPGFVVAHKNQPAEGFELIPNPKKDHASDVCGDSRLYTWLGLQTDYSEGGRGVLTPKMITTVLHEARECAREPSSQKS